MSGLKKKQPKEKWTYEEIVDEERSKMYLSRCKKKVPKRPSTFLHENKIVWKVRTTFRNAADKIVAATHLVFRDMAEFADQLSKSGRNLDLIDYFSKEVVTNVILRERLLKCIADKLPMQEDF